MPLIARLRRNRWLKETHPIYDECLEEWIRHERLIAGGRRVVRAELVRYDWEIEGGTHTNGRLDTAVYVNFPDRFASLMTGHLFQQAPTADEKTLDFGALGEVRRLRDVDRPTRAELLFYNADGIGADGSQWDPYWNTVARMACATGHRWVYVEGPPEAPGTLARERAGMRPYLTDFSPRSVTNWHYENGQLAFAVVHRNIRKPRMLLNGQLQGNKSEGEYLLLVRNGYDGLGRDYREGGWYTFDEDGTLSDFEVGWDATEGEIPMGVQYYERVRTQEDETRMSRSGIAEIGQAAVLDMNLTSAASWDLWDSASSVIALAGVDQKGFNLFVDMMKAGNRYAPLPMMDDKSQVPRPHDVSTGAVVQQAFQSRIEQNKQAILELMLNEIQVSPDASAAARNTAWTDVRAPRLATFASEIETTQNAVMRWMEMMWSGTKRPSASVQWKRKFDLLDPASAAALFLENQQLAGLSSDTLERKILVSLAKKLGLLGDDSDQTTVENEYKKSAEDRRRRAEADVQAAKAKQETTVSGKQQRSRPRAQIEQTRVQRDQSGRVVGATKKTRIAR